MADRSRSDQPCRGLPALKPQGTQVPCGRYTSHNIRRRAGRRRTTGAPVPPRATRTGTRGDRRRHCCNDQPGPGGAGRLRPQHERLGGSVAGLAGRTQASRHHRRAGPRRLAPARQLETDAIGRQTVQRPSRARCLGSLRGSETARVRRSATGRVRCPLEDANDALGSRNWGRCSPSLGAF
jgi:hypothetical protein